MPYKSDHVGRPHPDQKGPPRPPRPPRPTGTSGSFGSLRTISPSKPHLNVSNGTWFNETKFNHSRGNGKRGPPPKRGGELPYDETILNAVLITEIALILFLNLMVIISYFCMKKKIRLKIPNFLLLNQTFIDLLIGLSTVERVTCGECHPHSMSKITKFLLEYCMFLAVGFLLMCTLERFVCLKAPFKHRHYVTRAKLSVCILALWIVMTAPAFFYTYYISTFGKGTVVERYYFIVAAVLLLGMLAVYLILFWTYRIIHASLRKRLTSVTAMTANSIGVKVSDNIQATVENEQQKHAKLTKLFLLMATVYTITIIPMLIGTIIVDSIGITGKPIIYVKDFTYFLYISSSFLNPILTFIFKPDFRKMFYNKKMEKQDMTQSSVVTNASARL